MNNHRVITCYYLLLVGFVAIQAITTVYELGKTIGYGQKMAYLQSQKQELEQQKNLIQMKQAQQISLVKIDQELTGSYESIQKPIILTIGQNVASR